MNRKHYLIGLCVSFVAQLGIGITCRAQESGSGEAGNAKRVAPVIVEAVSSTAEVRAIDQEKRTVTLRTGDGAEATFHCGKDVANFDQIKVGDQVKATVIKSLAVLTRKPGEGEGNAAQATVALAPKGAMPGAMVAQTVEVTAKVVAIDQKTRMVTLEGRNGRSRTIHAGPSVDLSGVKKGDEVAFRYTEGLLLRVERGEGAQAAQVAASNLPAAIAVESVKTDAKVVAVDKEKRTVTLKRPDGSEQSFRVGKRVNLDGLDPGDEVKATLVEALAVAVRRPGTPAAEGESASAVLATADVPDKTVTADTIEQTATIAAIDPEQREVTLETPDGQCKTIHVSRRVNLDDVKPGDQVVVRFTTGVAALVEK